MKIIFFGTPHEVIPVLESLSKHFEIAAVVTAPDQKSGRKYILTPTPIKIFALEKKFRVFTPEILNDDFSKQLLLLKPDLLIVAAYGKIIPRQILTLTQYGAINIHPSLLPKYRGPTPIQTSLINGDRTSGISFIIMDEKMDHGPILHQIPVHLDSTDTFGRLMQNEFKQAAQVLPHILESYISGEILPHLQDDSLATYTKLITKENGKVDLNNPPDPEVLDRMIRAYHPWPSIWTTITVGNNKISSKIVKFLPDHKLQVEGKNPVSVKDFLNGYPHMKEILEKLGFI